MKKFPVGGSNIISSNIVMGCMHISSLIQTETEKLVRTAMDEGINFFDHADIYGGDHGCEAHFGASVSMPASLRERIYIQTKCAIRDGLYDFSKEHILKQVDGSLQALKTDYIDVLLLHRPDTLMEPEEVAEAFCILHSAGKVRHFGVSNQTSMQMELLQKYVPYKLIANQLQLSVAHTPMIDAGLAANMAIDQSIERTGEVLEYCRLKDITIQAWSPFQKGFFGGPFLGDMEAYPELNTVIGRIAKAYGVTDTTIAIAFLTRHPANFQVILGTTSIQRLKDACKASELRLTRDEWYEIYKAAGNRLP